MKENTENKLQFNQRLKEIIDNEHVSIKEFSEKLGYSRPQSIYDFLKGHVKPSYEFFNMFARSEYSGRWDIKWLLTGGGEMYLEESPVADDPGENSSHFTLDLIKETSDTQFRDIGQGRFLIVSPLVEYKEGHGYIKNILDKEYISNLRRHAVVVDNLYFGVYRSFEILETVKDEIIDELSYTKKSIVTGDRIQKVGGREMEFISDCVIVKKDGIAFVTFEDQSLSQELLFFREIKKGSGNERKQIQFSEILEIYSVRIVTSY